MRQLENTHSHNMPRTIVNVTYVWIPLLLQHHNRLPINHLLMSRLSAVVLQPAFGASWRIAKYDILA